MKTKWIVQLRTSTSGQEKETFHESFTEARARVSDIVRRIKFDKLLTQIRAGGDHPMREAIAGVIEDFSKGLLSVDRPIPCDDPNGDAYQDFFTHDEDAGEPEYDQCRDIQVELDDTGYLRLACGDHFLTTDVLYMQDADEDRFYGLTYKVHGRFHLDLTVKAREACSTADYPFLILRTLARHPQTLEEIIKWIREDFEVETKLTRKTVARNLRALAAFYPISHTSAGYQLAGEMRKEPFLDGAPTPAQYPFLVLWTLREAKQPLYKAEIGRRIQSKFGVTIDRKAIARHLELLQYHRYATEPTKGFFAVKTYDETERLPC